MFQGLRSRSRVRAPAAALSLLTLSFAGCGDADLDQQSVAATTHALVLTTCTGDAIAAAVAAGGDVLLSCGSSPVSIAVPGVTLSSNTVLRAAVPGTITLLSTNTTFTVPTGVSFELNDITMASSNGSGMAIHGLGGTVTVTRGTFLGYAFAVSVHHGTRLTIDDSLFYFNGRSNPLFGALYSEDTATMVVRRTLFQQNGTAGFGSGGALTAFGESLSISDSAFVANAASRGGAIYTTSRSINITNTTFSGNTGSAQAGALSISPTITSTPILRNVTFYENRGGTGTLDGKVPFATNTILVDSVSPAGANCAINGISNLQWPAGRPACGPSFIVADPLLDPLAYSGGPTPTMAPEIGSPAIDRATAICPPTDQRGVARPRDGDGNGVAACDLGALER